jgi:hypothetical protein
MSNAVIASTIIAGSGLILSIISAVFIAGFRWGSTQQQIRDLQHSANLTATKEDLAGVKESLAEIRGMFRLELKDK